jgi:hypothetical protein
LSSCNTKGGKSENAFGGFQSGFIFCFQIWQTSWVLGAHAYNPSYSGGRDQEDHGSKPGQANSSRDPISKNTQHKKRLAE